MTISRITIVAIGFRGDIQPLIGLGAGLLAAGAAVRFATTADFEQPVRAAGLDLHIVRGHAGAFFGGAAGVAIRERLADARAFRRFFDTYLERFYEELLLDLTEACRNAEAIVCWPWTRFATSLADAFRVPVFIACQYPPMHLPTAAFANPYQSAAAGDTASARRRSWRLALPAIQMGDAVLNRWRTTTLQLPPIGWREDLRKLRRLPHLLAFSTAVVPRPADWAPWIDVTGYWFLDEPAYQPPPALEAFLGAGPPPVCIGFSSQVGRDAARLTRTVVDAVMRAKQRAVLVTGFGGLKGVDFPTGVFPVPTVAYDWLFDKVAAVVHQGGAGSTALALRHGVPNVAVPFGWDQSFWASRLHALGAGPAPLPVNGITAEALASALTALVTDRSMRARAQALGAAIRSEDGVRRAVSIVLQTL